jgi:SAM-dependent methyltransferase
MRAHNTILKSMTASWDAINIAGHDEADYAKVHSGQYKILRELFLKRNPKKVLDVGIGTGNFYQTLPDYRHYEIHGIDIQPDFVEVLNKRGIPTKICDVSKEKFPYGNAEFDMVMCGAILEHTLNPKLLISEMHRVLKKDGSFILVVPNATSALRRFNHLRGRSIFEPLIYDLYALPYLRRCAVFYSPIDLRFVVRDYFQIDEMLFLNETGHDPDSFSWKVLRLLGRFLPKFRDTIITVGKKI